MTHLFFLLFSAAEILAAESFQDADVLFLGEQHDNPVHHERQAALVSELEPTALVFEMLSPEQADAITPELIADEAALEEALDWADSGWPDFSMYYPIFAAAPEAAYFGAAIPRADAREAMESGIITSFGEEADLFGLTEPLGPDEQSAREALQLAAHCDALPPEMLPMMVDIQRLRDAALARATRDAVLATDGPVAVITGNGHARPDRGAPEILAKVAPDLRIATFGQGEVSNGAPEGGFDATEIAPDVDRGDPCAAFEQAN